MRNIPRRLIPVFVLILVVIAVGGYYILSGSTPSTKLVVSGTIETTEVHLGTQFGGKVDNVNVKEGESVQEGQVLAEVHMSNGGEEQIRSTINGVACRSLRDSMTTLVRLSPVSRAIAWAKRWASGSLTLRLTAVLPF